MKQNSNRGFTLIELLVVIAIIGILSSVVLASLNSARVKAADSAVRSNMNNMRAQSELFYDAAAGAGTGYLGVCADPNFAKAMISAHAASAATAADTTAFATGENNNGVCQANTAKWAMQYPLKGGGYWCVDSTGKSQAEAAAMAGSAAACL